MLSGVKGWDGDHLLSIVRNQHHEGDGHAELIATLTDGAALKKSLELVAFHLMPLSWWLSGR